LGLSNSPEDPGFWLRETVAFILIWIGEDRKVCHEVIRFFSFDALGSTHVFCVQESIGDFFSSRLIKGGILRLLKETNRGNSRGGKTGTGGS
jgi:hypothetical protein